MLKPKEEDVVFGTGLRSTPGSRYFWKTVLSLREQYKAVSPGDQLEKSFIERQILESVSSTGGRFLRCDSHHQEEVFRQLPGNAALTKIRSALRDTYVPEFAIASSGVGTKPLSSTKPAFTAGSEKHEQLHPFATSTNTSGTVGMSSVSSTLPVGVRESFHPSPYASASTFAGMSTNPKADDNPNLTRREKSSVPSQTKANPPEFNAEGKLELRDEDVLAGQGSGPNNHPGNIKYLAEVRSHQEVYQALKLKERKKRSSIAVDIFNWVTKRNGRFLRRDSDGDYQELSINEALTKIKDALRDKKYRVSQEEDFEKGKMELPSKTVSPSPPINREDADNFKAVERNEPRNIVAQFGDAILQDAEDAVIVKSAQPDEMALSKLSISSRSEKGLERSAKRPASEGAKLASNDELSVAQAIAQLRSSSKPGVGDAALLENDHGFGKHGGVRIITDPTDTDGFSLQESVLQRKRMKFSTGTQNSLVLTDADVLGGRGGGSNNHPGNEEYWKQICALRSKYQAVNPRDHLSKCRIANQVFESVHERGGRFLERDTKTRVIYELPEKRALEKIKQALRDKYVPFSLREQG